MGDLSVLAPTSPDLVWQLVYAVDGLRENKYAFQVGLKDVDFEVDASKVRALGLIMPFHSIEQAEQALRERVITPRMFLENDGTEHRLAAFEPEPVGFSGFMEGVTHSLAATDHGLFEVGRYPALSLAGHPRYWQWFLHRRLATAERVAAWRADYGLSTDQLVQRLFLAMTGRQKARA